MSANHILIVEDEQHLAIGIKYNLEAEGYRVTAVGDGPSALALLGDRSDVDLVILDLMLPGMSGYDVCEQLRVAGRDIPVLILSARTLTEDRTRGFDVGADQYLSKPFDLDELLSRVKNLLILHSRRSLGARPVKQPLKRFTIGKSEIDFETFEVLTGDTAVRLTQMEMKLIRYFIENPSRVIPRYELLENVWETVGTINTRAPDQFIRRLRKIFEADPSKPRHFLTIRDAGYRFVAEPDAKSVKI